MSYDPCEILDRLTRALVNVSGISYEKLTDDEKHLKKNVYRGAFIVIAKDLGIDSYMIAEKLQRDRSVIEVLYFRYSGYFDSGDNMVTDFYKNIMNEYRRLKDKKMNTELEERILHKLKAEEQAEEQARKQRLYDVFHEGDKPIDPVHNNDSDSIIAHLQDMGKRADEAKAAEAKAAKERERIAKIARGE